MFSSNYCRCFAKVKLAKFWTDGNMRVKRDISEYYNQYFNICIFVFFVFVFFMWLNTVMMKWCGGFIASEGFYFRYFKISQDKYDSFFGRMKRVNTKIQISLIIVLSCKPKHNVNKVLVNEWCVESKCIMQSLTHQCWLRHKISKEVKYLQVKSEVVVYILTGFYIHCISKCYCHEKKFLMYL